LTGLAEISPCDRQPIAWTTPIKLPSIGELASLIKQEEVWGTCRAEVTSDRLICVIQIRECISCMFTLSLHLLWAILGVYVHIIGGDRDHLEPLLHHLSREESEPCTEMDDEWAVVTHENHERGIPRQVI
jgi:hypothetical protein